jgi:hypothetical protein
MFQTTNHIYIYIDMWIQAMNMKIMKSNTQGGMFQPTGLGQCELRQGNSFLEKKPCSRLQRAEKQNNRVTLWLCQNSYWKWPFIVDFPIKNGDFP